MEYMAEQFSHSEQLDQLFAAVAKAQGEMGNAKKSSKNPFFDSNYADLAECMSTCREPFSKNGLCIHQLLGRIIETVHFETDKNGNQHQKADYRQEITVLIGHSSGQWISKTGEYFIGKADIQGQGSATTYGRRYGLSGAVGLAQADDDGNSNIKVGTNRDGMFIIGKSGKPLPLAKMSVEQLNKLLGQPEYSAAFEVAKELIELKSRKDGSVTMADITAAAK